MADTTPNTSHDDKLKATINYLKNELKELNEVITKQGQQIKRRQEALIRIHRIWGEDKHACKLNLDLPSRMAWMQKIAQEASHTTADVNQAIDEPVEPGNVEIFKAKKRPAKVVGVGTAGEKSGF